MKTPRCILSTLLLFILLPSCRDLILEQRSECPTYLFLDITNPELFPAGTTLHFAAFSYPDQTLIREQSCALDSLQEEGLSLVLRQVDAVNGYGITGHRRLVKRGFHWTLPPGEDYDSLYRFCFYTPLQGEGPLFQPVAFVKDYMHVQVQFINSGDNGSTHQGPFPFELIVRGETNGINALDGTPLPGPYACQPPETACGHFSFNLPRQAEGTLRLDLYGKEGLWEKTGLIFSLDLDRILREEAGICWKEQNLPDVSLVINYLQQTIRITVSPQDWRSTNQSAEES